MIGLTGGIGSGKSTVAAILRQLGALVIDADQIAREVVRPGLPAYQEIVDAFGREILCADGTLDRRALGARVFADGALRQRLNAITHPRIAAETARLVAQAGAAGVPIIVYEASLLVENGLAEALDGLIVVKAAPETQRARVAARDGLPEDEIGRRMAAQLPTDRKAAVADYVVANDGTPAETRAQVEVIWRDLSAGGPAGRGAGGERE